MIAAFLRNFLRDLRRQPLRTVLTLSGVVWGTYSVVLLIAFGVSVHKMQLKRAHGMGQSLVIVWPARTTMAQGGFLKGRQIRLTAEEVEALPGQVTGIRRITPEFIMTRRIRFGRQELANSVRGVNPDFALMRNTIAETGRFIDPADLEAKRRVCFIGNTLAQDLFRGDMAVGRDITIEGVPFTVVGVMKEKQQNSNYSGQRDEHCAFIPWTTFAALYGQKHVSNLLFQPEDPAQSKPLIQTLRRHLGRRLGFDPRDEDALFVWDVTELEKTFNTFFSAFTVFLGLIGSFTLLVGGVGVASIMLVVVEERTREIGVKLAVGAKRGAILRQFFAEAQALILFGGGLGFLLAALTVSATARVKAVTDAVGTPVIDPGIALATVAILLVIGTVSGLMPARRAAGTDPIQALRK
jgi:putative ABC transport system permease protein